MFTMGYDFNLEVRKLTLEPENVFTYLSGYNCLYVDSGRSCIKLLCQLIQNGRLLVPAFSCYSVIYGFTNGVEPVFYAVNDDFTINFDDLMSKLTPDIKGIYITNYFGHFMSDEDARKINRIKEEYGILVFEDNTQSIFSGEPKAGDYCLASIRKWFAVPDGGVIYSKRPLDCIDISGLKKDSKQDDKLYPQIIKSMVLKDLIDCPVEFIVDLFAKVENELNEYADNNEIYLMSDFTEFIFKCNNLPWNIEKRKENERYLRTLIRSPYLRFAIPKLNTSDCPFNLPMYCTHRDEMWDYLVNNYHIYPSVLWRTYQYAPVKDIGPTSEMGREIISFPIDQRYSREDMEYLADAINSFVPNS